MKNKEKQNLFIERDISWLAFNERVLQEAEDVSTPPINRLKFLGIFSNNQDEFFRVRVATLKRFQNISKEAKLNLGFNPKKSLQQVYDLVLQQQQRFELAYENIKLTLKAQNVFIINHKELNKKHGKKVKEFFHEVVRPYLVPLMINDMPHFPDLKDGTIYLAVSLAKKAQDKPNRFALIELPTDKISRFYLLEKENGKIFIMLIDDVIRYCLKDIFAIAGFKNCNAYTIKITKDAELDIDNDVSKSFLELLQISVKNRKLGNPTRFIYDQEMPAEMLQFLLKKLNISMTNNAIAGGAYHNFKDFMRFPNISNIEPKAIDLPPLPNLYVNPKKSLFKLLKTKDILINTPYQSYLPIIDFLREAAIDPKVTFIKITLYRLAKHSNIINALINARKNGKHVTAFMEIQARFDEEANIEWAKKLQEAGVKVVHGQQNLKIHAKMCLIARKENSENTALFAHIATGNYNEDTAKIYSDISLLTTHTEITKEVFNLFDMLENKKRKQFKHLLLSPNQLKNKLIDFIDFETKQAQQGKDAYIIIKVNTLTDESIIKKLYTASSAGVQIKLIVRGACSLVPNIPTVSHNIEAISIVDNFLEHARVFVFCHAAKDICYISSADLMERNLIRRVEIACPIYDNNLKFEIKQMLTFQLNDNLKARIQGTNEYKKNNLPILRSQTAIYEYLKTKLLETQLNIEKEK